MNEQTDSEIAKRYTIIKNKQLIAIVLAVCLMIVLSVMAKRPDLFLGISGSTCFKIEVFVILLFVNFTALNWKCPSCKKYLGHDIGKKNCRKCRFSSAVD